MAYKKRTRKVTAKRVDTPAKRKNLYKWAEGLKPKRSLIRIGSKMKSIKRTGGKGAKLAINGLALIAEKKKAFAQGYAVAKGRQTWNTKRKK